MVGPHRNRREGASDVVARMLAVVPYLIENSPVSVAETAQRFDTSESAIRDIVRTLFTTGVPGESGVGLPDDLFDFDYDTFIERDIIDMTHHVGPAQTPRFSGYEAAALIAGLQYIADAVRPTERPRIEELITKVARGSSTQAEVTVVTVPLPQGGLNIAGAIESQRQVSFLYNNAVGARERRRVDPIRLDLVTNVWYLRAHCHLRHGPRTFRLDRMREIAILDQPCETQTDPHSLGDVSFDVDPGGSDLTITAEISESAVPLISDYRATLRYLSSGVIRGTLLLAHEASLRRLVCRVPGGVTVLSPETSVTAIGAWARACADHHALTPESDAPSA